MENIAGGPVSLTGFFVLNIRYADHFSVARFGSIKARNSIAQPTSELYYPFLSASLGSYPQKLCIPLHVAHFYRKTGCVYNTLGGRNKVGSFELSKGDWSFRISLNTPGIIADRSRTKAPHLPRLLTYLIRFPCPDQKLPVFYTPGILAAIREGTAFGQYLPLIRYSSGIPFNTSLLYPSTLSGNHPSPNPAYPSLKRLINHVEISTGLKIPRILPDPAKLPIGIPGCGIASKAPYPRSLAS